MNGFSEESASSASSLYSPGVLLAVASLAGLAVTCVAHRGFVTEPRDLYMAELGPFALAVVFGTATRHAVLRRFEWALMLFMASALLTAASAASVHVAAEQYLLDTVSDQHLFGGVTIALNGVYAFALSLFAANDGLLKFVAPSMPMLHRVERARTLEGSSPRLAGRKP
jgi:uncharacterized protein (DUF2345 family)